MNHRLEGGCQVPIGVYAELKGDEIYLRGLVGALDGSEIIRAEATGPQTDPETLGVGVAEDLLAQGAGASCKKCMAKPDALTLLNTRPQHQAAHLTRLAEHAGVEVLACPTIEIEPQALPESAATCFKRFDKIVFVSRNAVSVLQQLFQTKGLASPPFGESAQCFAIGQATQQALQAQGWPLASLDIKRFVSEDLLATEALQDLQGQRCLIVKGEGGVRH